MQAWQKLWPHGVDTGLVKTSRQMEQVNWSSDRKAAGRAMAIQHQAVQQKDPRQTVINDQGIDNIHDVTAHQTRAQKGFFLRADIQRNN